MQKRKDGKIKRRKEGRCKDDNGRGKIWDFRRNAGRDG